MADEVTLTNEIKTASDGTVKISVEKYNELVEKVANQKDSIRTLKEQLNQARNAPPVINRTVVNKTDEMVAQDHRVWGATFMATGVILFGIGAFRYKAGLS